MAKKRKSRKRFISPRGARRLVEGVIAAPSQPKKIYIRRKPSVEELMARKGIIMNTDSNLVYKKYLMDKQRALEYKKYNEMNLSPYTQAQLGKVAAIQNKAKTDDYKRQRIKREQEIIAKATNILSTPYVFKDKSMDVTNVDNQNNILMAPNVFKEREDNPHILESKRLNILQTREAGNELYF